MLFKIIKEMENEAIFQQKKEQRIKITIMKCLKRDCGERRERRVNKSHMNLFVMKKIRRLIISNSRKKRYKQGNN